MDKQILDLRKELLSKHFDAVNAERIAEWLVASENRRPVLLIGAGFSRNALHRRRHDHARPSEVPLWSNILARMASDLGVAASHYDPPTMAEMYAASFGEARLRDVLLEALPDADLEPGEAHLALGRYDAEAIVTTNLLDTLLDSTRLTYDTESTRIIVYDTDLSAADARGRRVRDLIYFHGHRSASGTWVLTRSQYEDVPRTRPVILTRVRQLISQHPLLIVGFGMGDPNFHQVYRQLAGDMGGHQPLGLAIQLEHASTAELRHWDSLGIRIASPRTADVLRSDPAQSSTFFAWLFKNLSTFWSPDDVTLLAYVKRATDITERFKRFRRLLPLRASPPHESYHEQRSEEFRAWQEALFSIASEYQNRHARRRSEEGRAWVDASYAGSVSTVTGAGGPVAADAAAAVRERPMFAHLPDWRELSVNRERIWLLDAIVGAAETARDALAEHFFLALDRGLFRTEEAEANPLPWIPLTFWLATRAAVPAVPLPDLAQQCIAECEKYDDEHWVALVRRVADETHVVPLSDVVPDKVTTGPEERPEVSGFSALLDARYADAHGAYRKAAALAEAEGTEFEEWAWRSGEAYAVGILLDLYSTTETLSDTDRARLAELRESCRARRRVLEAGPIVRSWLAQARSRIRKVLDDALDLRDGRDRRRATGGSGFSIQGPHLAWRSFRDLQVIHAPPTLQREYLAPLLRESRFSASGEFDLRLTLAVKDVRSWLHRLVDEQSATLAARRDRDRSLVEVFFSSEADAQSATGRLQRLLAMPSLADAWSVTDIDRLLGWLRETRGRLGTSASTYSSRHSLDADYARALRSVAALCGAEGFLSLYKTWWESGGPVEREELARAADGFPWHRWTVDDAAAVAAWLRWTTADDLGGEPLSRGHMTLVFAIVEAAHRLRRASPTSLTDELSNQMRRYAGRLHAVVQPRWSRELRRGGYLLERLLTSDAQSAAWESIERWSSSSGTGKDTDDLQLRWSLIADAIDGVKTIDGSDIERELRAEWARLSGPLRWGKLASYYAQNPYEAASLARVLVACVAHLPDLRGAAVPRLLELATSAPNVLPLCAPVLRPAMLGDLWWATIEHIGRTASGVGSVVESSPLREDTSGAPTGRQLAAVDLWAECSRLRRSGAEVGTVAETRDLLLLLRTVGIASVGDDRALLANHAAFAVVAAAEVAEDPSEVAVLNLALRRAAADTRAGVRMAAAYAGGRLKTRARSTAVRDEAVKIWAQLASDQNARVRMQLDQGERDGGGDIGGED